MAQGLTAPMLIDSDVLVWLTRGHVGAAKRLHAINLWRISAATYIELAQGCRDKADLARPKKGLAVRNTEIVPVTPAISQRASALIVSSEERAFFVSLGERIASLRRANNITQVQLAEALGVSQQTLQSYEVGRRRLPVSALPAVASTLSVSLEELFGTQTGAGGKRGPAPQWQQQIEAVAQLPKSQQQFVARMIKTVLAEASAR
jgi:transcriptional regulator with XRE-family HTH domain